MGKSSGRFHYAQIPSFLLNFHLCQLWQLWKDSRNFLNQLSLASSNDPSRQFSHVSLLESLDVKGIAFMTRSDPELILILPQHCWFSILKKPHQNGPQNETFKINKMFINFDRYSLLTLSNKLTRPDQNPTTFMFSFGLLFRQITLHFFTKVPLPLIFTEQCQLFHGLFG